MNRKGVKKIKQLTQRIISYIMFMVLLGTPASVLLIPGNSVSAKQVQAEFLYQIVYSPSGFAGIMHAYSDGEKVTYADPNEIPSNARWVTIAPFLSQLDEGVEFYFSRDGTTTEKRFIELNNWSDFPADVRWLTVSNFDGAFGEGRSIRNQEYTYSVDGITVQRGSEVPANALWATLSSYQVEWAGELKTLDYSRSHSSFTLDVDAIQAVTIGSDATDSRYATVGNVITLSFTTLFPIKTPTVWVAGHPVDVRQDNMNWIATYTLTSADTEGNISFQIDYEEEDSNERKSRVTTTDDSFVHFDRTAPTISLQQTPNTWTKSHVLITATVTDHGGSGVIEQKWAEGQRGIEYFRSAGESVTDNSFHVPTNGYYTWYAKDLAGNESVETIQVTSIDRETPILDINYSQEWTRDPVEILVDVGDTPSGIQYLKWAEGEQSATYVQANGTSITNGSFWVQQNGKYTIYAANRAGSNALEIIAIDHIDRAPPSIILTPFITTPTNENVLISVDISDEDSALAEKKWAEGEHDLDYFVDNGDILTTDTITVSKNSTYTFYAKDNAGNEVVKGIDITNIFKVPPTLSLTSSADTWTNQPVTIFVDISTDNGIREGTKKWEQGEHDIDHFMNNGNPLDDRFTVLENDTYTVYVEDEAGNKAVGHIFIDHIDLFPPELEVEIERANWTNQPVTVIVNATDQVGVIQALKWSPGSQTEEFFVTSGETIKDSQFTVEANGDYTIFTQDEAGNGTLKVINVTNIDRDDPTIQLTYSNEPTNQNVRIEAAIQDATSGVAVQKWATGIQSESYFELGGTTFSDFFEAELNGFYTVYAQDQAGNTTLETLEILSIHKEEPVIQHKLFPTEPTQGSVTVTASVYSEMELATRKKALGFHELTYFQQEGEPWLEDEGQIEVHENGWISFYVKDQAGNETVKQIEIANIDREAPVISLLGEPNMNVYQGSVFLDPGAMATDNLDGDISSKIQVSGQVDTQIIGEFSLQYNVSDAAGNPAEEVTRIVKVIPRPVIDKDYHEGGGPPAVSGDSKEPKDEEKKNDTPEDSGQCPTKQRCEGNGNHPLFTDVEGHWAKEAIYKLVALKLVKGYPDGTFKPNRSITRAEFITLLVNSLELEPNPEFVFTDTNQHWAQEAISTARYYGLANGYSETAFGPNDSLTREQMAVMIAKSLKLPTSSGSAEGYNNLPYSDKKEISIWAQEAVQHVVENKLMVGLTDDHFHPQALASRAQAVVVITRLLQHSK